MLFQNKLECVALWQSDKDETFFFFVDDDVTK